MWEVDCKICHTKCNLQFLLVEEQLHFVLAYSYLFTSVGTWVRGRLLLLTWSETCFFELLVLWMHNCQLRPSIEYLIAASRNVTFISQINRFTTKLSKLCCSKWLLDKNSWVDVLAGAWLRVGLGAGGLGAGRVVLPPRAAKLLF